MQKLSDELPDEVSRDYAIVDVERGFVVLEAGEWCEKIGQHRVVTVLIHPAEARILAIQLNRQAQWAEGRAKTNDLN